MVYLQFLAREIMIAVIVCDKGRRVHVRSQSTKRARIYVRPSLLEIQSTTCRSAALIPPHECIHKSCLYRRHELWILEIDEVVTHDLASGETLVNVPVKLWSVGLCCSTTFRGTMQLKKYCNVTKTLSSTVDDVYDKSVCIYI